MIRNLEIGKIPIYIRMKPVYNFKWCMNRLENVEFSVCNGKEWHSLYNHPVVIRMLIGFMILKYLSMK